MICRTRGSAGAEDQADPPTATPLDTSYVATGTAPEWGVASGAADPDERTLEPGVWVSMSAAVGPVASGRS